MEEDMDDLQSLKEYAENGSEEAFSAVVSHHVGMVYTAALRRTGNAQAAEEITQAVFIVLAKKAGSLRRNTLLAAWLHEAVRLTSAAYQRSETRRIRREQEAAMQSLSKNSEPDTWSQLAPILDDAIGDLNEKDRKAILCRYFEGKSLTEVGAALGTNEDAAHKRVTRAIDKLRAYFHRRGIPIPAAALAGLLTANAVHAAPVGIAASVATAASLKGVSAASSIVALSKGTLNLMAWTKLETSVGVGLALLLTTGTSLLLYNETAAAQKQSTIAVVTITAPAPSPSTNYLSKRPPAFKWDHIESTDYRQYMANLRAAGFPEQVIRDIVEADVLQQFAKRGREFLGTNNLRPYWKKWNDYSPTRQQYAQYRDLRAQANAVLSALLGVRTNEVERFMHDNMLGGVSVFTSMVAWLPPEKRDAARRAFEEADMWKMEDTMAQRFEKSVALLTNILTPAELEEYRLRESPVASRIQNSSLYANLTEEEYKALYHVLEQKPVSKLPTDGRDGKIEKLAESVGTERANQIIMETDSTYLVARGTAELYGLPIETAEKVTQLKWAAEQSADQIVADTSRSRAERRKELAAIQASTDEALITCVGPDAAKVLRVNSGWLDLSFYLQ